MPAVLSQETEQIVERPVGHIDNRLNESAEAVKVFQESRLFWQVAFDRLPDAGIKKLGVRRRIEEAVEVRGVVEDADIVRVDRLPLNDRQKPPGIGFQNRAVFIDSLKNRCGYRKVNALRATAVPREDEGKDGGGDDGVQALLGAAVESDHSLDKR